MLNYVFQSIYNIYYSNTDNFKDIIDLAGIDRDSDDINDIDMSDIDLSNQDLSNLDLRYVEFRNSTLTKTNFKNSLLNPKKLSYAKNNALDAILDDEMSVAIKNIELLDQPIYRTNIRTQERNIIRSCGITNIGRLATIKDAQILNIFGIGKQTLKDITRFLEIKGLRLGMRIHWDDILGDEICERNMRYFLMYIEHDINASNFDNIDELHEFARHLIFSASLNNIHFQVKMSSSILEVNAYCFSASAQRKFRVSAPCLSMRPIMFQRMM